MTLNDIIIMAAENKPVNQLNELIEFSYRWRDVRDLPLEDLLITEAPKPEEVCATWLDGTDETAHPLLRRGWKCSKCGRRQTYGTTTHCPYCGAKMK